MGHDETKGLHHDRGHGKHDHHPHGHEHDHAHGHGAHEHPHDHHHPHEHGGHGHDHAHEHPHDHGHSHDHEHAHGAHVHVHAHSHGHTHDHGHGHHHGPPVDEAPRIHKASAPVRAKVGVITASDTRTEADDTSGRYLAETLIDRGHLVVHRQIVRDEPALVRAAIAAARDAGAEAVIVTGGTGISRRDSTFEALEGLLVRKLPGFGELFRMLSFAEIGSAAMLSRATAGITAEGLLVFAVPGSTGACRTALERLIAPELGHLLRELHK